MRTNIRAQNALRTHEGAMAHPINAEAALRRSVLSCLLFEKEFYEDGVEIAGRITALAETVQPEMVAALAIEARTEMHLRHVPLKLLEVLSRTAAGRTDALVAKTIGAVISRADELAEFLAIYTAGGDRRHAATGRGHQFTAQVMRGLDLALRRFDAYQLAKYDRAGKVKLRDVFRIVRPKPDDDAQAALFKAAKDGTLPAPDTWEVALSGGAETKREVFERLMTGDKLGYLALLRNLRNMAEAGVDRDLITDKIALRKGAARVLPFRYVAAARVVPQFEPALDKALLAAISELPVFSGRTALLVDVSGSMDLKLSARSDISRMDAAATLAAIFPGDVRLFTFSEQMVEVPARRGMAGIDAIKQSQSHGGTYLGRAVMHLNSVAHDRLVVITDEQSHDGVPQPEGGPAYLINVANNRNGVGYGRWTHIDGFSENVLRFMRAFEDHA